MPIKSYREFVTKFFGSQFRNIRALEAFDYFLFSDHGMCIEHLQSLSKRKLEDKHANTLVSPAYFDSDACEITSRGERNVVFLRGVFLDNDGGGIGPDKIAEILHDVEIVVFNTHSSTAESPRYRVYIPTTTIFLVQTHELIFDQIWARFHAEGYRADSLPQQQAGQGRFHGFDGGKRGPSSLFYLPCEPRDPSGRIFRWYHGTNRKVLDPRVWIDAYSPPDSEDEADENEVTGNRVATRRDFVQALSEDRGPCPR